MYRVVLTKEINPTLRQSEDITKFVSELTWSENLDTVGLTLSFSVPDTNAEFVPRLKIMAGDIIQIFNGEGELIRAVVVNISRSYPKRTVKAFDFGFYLNKNDIVIQFKDKSVSECLKELFYHVGVTTGSVCDMPAKVKSVYIKNVNEIIKELIKIQQDNDGKKYYYEMRAEKIYVFQLPTKPMSYIFKPTVNTAEFDVTDKNAHGRGTYSCSIENMRNSIIAEVNSKTSGEMPEKMFYARDPESIRKHGLLAENYNVNSDDADNIKELAKNELKEKNVIKQELSMDFIGHDNARPGRVIRVIDEYLGINGNFRIKSVSHKINGSIHTMSCTLERI